MIPQIKRILYATDLSGNAVHAFRYAAYLAKQVDAEIIIFHIVEKPTAEALLTLQAYLDKKDRFKFQTERIEQVIVEIEQRLEKFCETELTDDPDCQRRISRVEVREGYPAEEILDKSERWDCDLIVMGSHEKSLSHTFLGSVAKRVLRRSRIPMVVIPLARPNT
jgi:nucleotide-binding universal stress UspA family protein